MSLWIGGYELLRQQPCEFTESDDESDVKCLSLERSPREDRDSPSNNNTVSSSKALKNTKRDSKEVRRDSAEMSVIDRTRYMVYSKENQEPYDHMKDAQDFYRVTEEFKSAMKKDPIVRGNHEVKLVVKATLTPSVKEKYASKCSRTHDSRKSRLYYCGGLDDPGRLTVIIKQGFTEKDFSSGEFGRGLYFSLHPSRAAHFSVLNKLLIAEVAVGTSLYVDKRDHTRASAPQGYDSVMTPGRLSSSSTFASCDAATQAMNEEYIVFDVNQVLPLHILEYSLSRPSAASNDAS